MGAKASSAQVMSDQVMSDKVTNMLSGLVTHFLAPAMNLALYGFL
jgi:hypothetical protein